MQKEGKEELRCGHRGRIGGVKRTIYLRPVMQIVVQIKSRWKAKPVDDFQCNPEWYMYKLLKLNGMVNGLCLCSAFTQFSL